MNDGLVVVYTALGELQAHAFRAKLESAGIPAMIEGGAPSTFPFTVDGLGEFRLKVPVEMEGEARAVLADTVDLPEDDQDEE